MLNQALPNQAPRLRHLSHRPSLRGTPSCSTFLCHTRPIRGIFFIHIATITVGLLIAISLEQTVEWVHHREQLHQLEEQLQDEARENARRIEISYSASDAELLWLLGLQRDVQATLAGHGKSAYRPRPESAPGVPVLWELAHTAVWDAARVSGVAALLPASRAEWYTGDLLRVPHTLL
jgi:hypothetical protein